MIKIKGPAGLIRPGIVHPAVNLSGTTEPFEGNGRKLGYPTANMRVDVSLVEGVYFGYANLGKIINNPALIFIGTPVTIGASDYRVEAHLFDIADKDHYNEPLSIQICYFHRVNQHFETIDELTSNMIADEDAARKWFIINSSSGRT